MRTAMQTTEGRPIPRFLKTILAVFLASFLLLTGCGQKGPLYLSDDQLSADQDEAQGEVQDEAQDQDQDLEENKEESTE